MNENMAITGFPLTDLIIRGYLWFANKHIGGFDVISTKKCDIMDLSRLGIGGIQQPEYLFPPVIFPPDGSHQVECWNLFGASELKSPTKVVCW